MQVTLNKGMDIMSFEPAMTELNLTPEALDIPVPGFLVQEPPQVEITQHIIMVLSKTCFWDVLMPRLNLPQQLTTVWAHGMDACDACNSAFATFAKTFLNHTSAGRARADCGSSR